MSAGAIGTTWRELKVTESCSCDEKTFLKAIEIWLLKPQVVNRRLIGAVILRRTYAKTCNIDEVSTNQCSLLKLDGQEVQFDIPKETIQEDSGSACDAVENVATNEVLQQEAGGDCCVNVTHRFEICTRKFLPRQTRNGRNETSANEVVIIDRTGCIATFVQVDKECGESPCTADDHCHNNGFVTAYRLRLKSSRISLYISESYKEPSSPSLAVTRPTIAWLQDCLLPKIARWASVVRADEPIKNSQYLVSMERYAALYGELREKYGAKFVEIWPETTDPLKFVYEDVAIATYLLVLWEQERTVQGLKERQSFVDLGCGNGLLVHILNSEGHPGKGIDLRRRKIWDLYGPGTNLEECSITPSDDFLFTDYDWLIGNHSDELTPWIPVMAARSSYTTRYFVLPCCFHDFDVKYIRSGQAKTQYRSYLDFIQDIGAVCGFVVQEDTLRIPSTKRVCQIGSKRNHPIEKANEIQRNITEYIDRRRTANKRSNAHGGNPGTGVCNQLDDSDSNHSHCINEGSVENLTGSGTVISLAKQWAPDFRPRKPSEPVRNCARVDYTLKQKIINEVACAILDRGDAGSPRGEKEMKLWRRGGSMTLAEIAQLLGSGTLTQLKTECGGLKTLLKNANQVFQVSGNRVEIRNWSLIPSTHQTGAKKSRFNAKLAEQCFKTRICWFHSHHPDGCPRGASECQFAHGPGELRKLVLPSR